MDVVPLCIAGAPPRSDLWVRALRRLRSGVYADCLPKAQRSGSYELRITCLCGGTPEERELLRWALCEGSSPGGEEVAAAEADALADYEDFDEVLVMEEFGDHLCSAVLILFEDVGQRVRLAAQAMSKGKHVLMEPWAPASATAMRWGGLDDAFRQLWDHLRSSNDRAVCEFAQPLNAVARLFVAWLEAQGLTPRETSVSAVMLEPRGLTGPPLQGAAGSERIAWLRPLREWLHCGHDGKQDATSEQPLALHATVGPQPQVCLLTAGTTNAGCERPVASAAMVSWPQEATGAVASDEDRGGLLSCRLTLTAASFAASLLARGFLGCVGGTPGLVEGAVVLHEGSDAGVGGRAQQEQQPRRFALSEVEALVEELRRFTDRIAAVQDGRCDPAEAAAAAAAAELGDRSTYAEILRAAASAASSAGRSSPAVQPP